MGVAAFQCEGPLHLAGGGIEAADAAFARDDVNCGGLVAIRALRERRRRDYGAAHERLPAFLARGTADAVNVAIAAAEIDLVLIDGGPFNDAIVHIGTPDLLAGLGLDAQHG